MSTISNTVNLIIQQRKKLDKLRREFKKQEMDIEFTIDSMNQRLRDLVDRFDSKQIKLAESIIAIEGNPHAMTRGIKPSETIAQMAIIDAAQGFPYLQKKYLGNKRHGDVYKRCDFEYGKLPAYGKIVDRIRLKTKNTVFSATEKSAVIYYLMNYEAIEAIDEIYKELKSINHA